MLGGAITLIVMLAVLLIQLVVTHDGNTHAGWHTLGLHRLGLRIWGFAILALFLVMLCTYTIAWGTRISRLDLVTLNGVFELDGQLSILRTMFNILLVW